MRTRPIETEPKAVSAASRVGDGVEWLDTLLQGLSAFGEKMASMEPEKAFAAIGKKFERVLQREEKMYFYLVD